MSYPFSAVVGQETAKRSLLLCLVDPGIGGGLLLGEKGTGKSTLSRSAARLADPAPFVNLPVSASEEMLTGCLDVAASLSSGQKTFQPGILQRAHGGILYIDEVNLLPDALSTTLVDAAAAGLLRVEREGISRVIETRFVLVASMNPEEGGVRPQLTDRFGMAVAVSGPKDRAQRAAIVRRRLAYESDPEAFRGVFEEEETRTRSAVRSARMTLATIRPTPENRFLAATAAAEAGAAGHRGEIIIVRVARALAALDGRSTIEPVHIQEAAYLALAHRVRRPKPDATPAGCPDPDYPNRDRVNSGDRHQGDDESERAAADQERSGREHRDTAPERGPIHHLNGEGSARKPVKADSEDSRAESLALPQSVTADGQTFGIAEGVDLPDLFGKSDRRIAKKRDSAGSGRRLRFVSDSSSGRYVRHRYADPRPHDIAVDATLRAAVLRAVSAAPHVGQGDGTRLVRPEDLREKVRVRRAGGHIVFVVDASGSMAGARRMSLAKGAVFSLLGESYRMRDTVAMVTFRGNEAEVVLPPTRSVTLAHRRLRDVPTGGRTPLAEAIRVGCRTAERIKTKDRGAEPVVIFVTDGRDRPGAEPVTTAAENCGLRPRLARAARAARSTGLRFVWIDTENPWVRVGTGNRIAEALGAEYVRV